MPETWGGEAPEQSLHITLLFLNKNLLPFSLPSVTSSQAIKSNTISSHWPQFKSKISETTYCWFISIYFEWHGCNHRSIVVKMNLVGSFRYTLLFSMWCLRLEILEICHIQYLNRNLVSRTREFHSKLWFRGATSEFREKCSKSYLLLSIAFSLLFYAVHRRRTVDSSLAHPKRMLNGSNERSAYLCYA